MGFGSTAILFKVEFPRVLSIWGLAFLPLNIAPLLARPIRTPIIAIITIAHTIIAAIAPPDNPPESPPFLKRLLWEVLLFSATTGCVGCVVGCVVGSVVVCWVVCWVVGCVVVGPVVILSPSLGSLLISGTLLKVGSELTLIEQANCYRLV